MPPTTSLGMVQSILLPRFVTVAAATNGSGGPSIGFMVPGGPGGGAKLVFHHERVVMVGLLFAPPGAPLTESEILPRLPQFHARTGTRMDFFCAGYEKLWAGAGAAAAVDYDFDVASFESFRREIEGETRWRYSGDVDLLLMNANLDRGTGTVALDFQRAIVCQLDQMIRDKAIRSVGELVELITRYVESADGRDPTWGFSDAMGKKVGAVGLVGLVLSLLPASVAAAAKRARHFAIREVGRAA